MSAKGTRGKQETKKQGCGWLSAGLIALLLAALATIALFSTWLVLNVALQGYEGRIYPHVHVLDLDLGGLTPGEAAARLLDALQQQESALLVLRDGEQQWPVAWSDLGMHLDVEATVRAALAAGRTDRTFWTPFTIWLGRRDVAPVLVVDADAARQALEQLTPVVSAPPVDATVRLQDGQLVPVPGRPGRVLDVEVTLAHLLATAGGQDGVDQVALAFRIVLPQVADAGPALAQAEAVLERPIILSAHDVLTDETFTWSVERETIVSWLTFALAPDGSGPQVRADRQAVQVTLAELAQELDGGRGLRLEEGAEQVAQVLESGGGMAHLYLTHPPRSYTVQPGDTLSSIGRQFGMPPGMLAEANPALDADHLQVGQQLTIPSQDELTPYLPVPGKRIVVSLAEQRMRVYENDQLLYDWPVSTGVSSSPTYSGTFQVLNKEENAYASQWDLWMPHFIAIYRAGADVYNGIHALPILSNGRRLWEGALGTPASYGCIILGVSEAETLYHWVDIGVLVIIE